MNENRYPCCSATPAQTTFADAPIKVPFPKISIDNFQYHEFTLTIKKYCFETNLQDMLQMLKPKLMVVMVNLMLSSQIKK